MYLAAIVSFQIWYAAETYFFIVFYNKEDPELFPPTSRAPPTVNLSRHPMQQWLLQQSRVISVSQWGPSYVLVVKICC